MCIVRSFACRILDSRSQDTAAWQTGWTANSWWAYSHTCTIKASSRSVTFAVLSGFEEWWRRTETGEATGEALAVFMYSLTWKFAHLGLLISNPRPIMSLSAPYSPWSLITLVPTTNASYSSDCSGISLARVGLIAISLRDATSSRRGRHKMGLWSSRCVSWIIVFVCMRHWQIVMRCGSNQLPSSPPPSTSCLLFFILFFSFFLVK